MLPNLQRLPTIAIADKSTQFLEQLKKHLPDVTMLNDVGLAWKNLPIEDQWVEQAMKAGSTMHCARFSHNGHESQSSMVQWGGTGLPLMDEARPRLSGKMGSDPTNLGRWTWAGIQGRHGHFLRVVAAYQPVINNSETGSMYQQQKRYFRKQKKWECPRTLFVKDPQHQLQEWLAEGDQIIVGLDANDDVQNSPIQKMFQELGMREAILDLHQEDPPETNYKNNQRKPIDVIFCTPGITPTNGGYCPYKTIVDSDHRALWLDIPFTSALGHNPPNLHKHEIRPVKAGEPRSVKQFVSWVKKGLDHKDCHVKQDFAALKQMRKEHAHLSDIIEMHATALSELTDVKRWASNKAKKSFFGKYAWSPEWKEHKLPMTLWKKVIKRFDVKVKVQPKFLKRLMRQCNEPGALHLTKEEAEQRLVEAQIKFDDACTGAAVMRKAHIRQLAKALAEKNKTSEETELKKLNQRSKQRRRAKRLRRARKKPSKGLATKLYETTEGVETFLETQEELVRASAEENCVRCTRCQTSSFLRDQLLADIGLLMDGPFVPATLDGSYTPPPGTGFYETKFLEGCKIPECIMNEPPLPFTVTKEETNKDGKNRKNTPPVNPLLWTSPCTLQPLMMTCWQKWMQS